MEYTIIGLVAFAAILLVISIFLKDPYKELKNELDQFSMQQIQEVYQIKRKLKILEEELLIEEEGFSSPTFEASPTQKKPIHAIIKNQVWSLAQQGLTIDQISKQSSLTVREVQEIIGEFSTGERYE